jgi:hypothetical protein
MPEQRLLSAKTCLRWRWSYKFFGGRRLIDLGFSRREAIYRRKGEVAGHPGGHTFLGANRGGPAPRGDVPTSVPSSVSALDSVFGSEKIGGLAFVSSNSKNISCTIFLKYKNNRKHGLTLWHLVNRLVPENA